MQADAGVNPYDEKQDTLSPGAVGPDEREHVSVLVVGGNKLVRASHVGEVREEKKRDRQAGRDLDRLPGRDTLRERRPTRTVLSGMWVRRCRQVLSYRSWHTLLACLR